MFHLLNREPRTEKKVKYQTKEKMNEKKDKKMTKGKAKAKGKAKKNKPHIECPICCENVPPSQQVKCDKCNFETCKTCLKTYIMDEPEPRCINPSCKALISECTMMMKITKKFLQNDYREHKSKVWVDVEKAKIPGMMDDIAMYKKGMDLVMGTIKQRINHCMNKLLYNKLFSQCEIYHCDFMSNLWWERGKHDEYCRAIDLKKMCISSVNLQDLFCIYNIVTNNIQNLQKMKLSCNSQFLQGHKLSYNLIKKITNHTNKYPMYFDLSSYDHVKHSPNSKEFCEKEVMTFMNGFYDQIKELNIYDTLERIEKVVHSLEKNEINGYVLESPNDWSKIVKWKTCISGFQPDIQKYLFQHLSLEQYYICYKRIMLCHILRGILYRITVRINHCQRGYLMYQNMEAYEYLKNDIRRQVTERDSKTKFNYVTKCPANNCMGMLDDNMTCKLCHAVVCNKCMDIIGNEGDEKLKEHVCDENTLASAKMIRKETKPCPKCSARIYKIEGCDQMWCTKCNIPFSWNTGTIIKGRIHNPHYFEWLKQNNDERATRRAPTEILCGGIPEIRQYVRKINRNPYLKSGCYSNWENNEKIKYIFGNDEEPGESYYTWFSDFWLNVFRIASHIQHSLLTRLRREMQNEPSFKKETVLYTLKQMDEKDYAKVITSSKVKREKTQNMLDIYEMLSAVLNECVREVFNILPEPESDNPKQIDFVKLNILYERVNNIIAYGNQELVKCSVVHGLTVEFIRFNGLYRDDDNVMLIYEIFTGITKKFLKKHIMEKQDENGKMLHWHSTYRLLRI